MTLEFPDGFKDWDWIKQALYVLNDGDVSKLDVAVRDSQEQVKR